MHLLYLELFNLQQTVARKCATKSKISLDSLESLKSHLLLGLYKMIMADNHDWICACVL